MRVHPSTQCCKIESSLLDRALVGSSPLSTTSAMVTSLLFIEFLLEEVLVGGTYN